MKQETPLKVNLCIGDKSSLVGRLFYRDRQVYFEYDTAFLNTGIEISPLKLPLKPGLIICDATLFDGLFGVFADSLPDGWGRLLLDRKLSSLGVDLNRISPVDRLRYVGKRGMGALQYEPEISLAESQDKIDNLDAIAKECLAILDHEEEQFVDHLLALNGSSAGARPKILVNLRTKQQVIFPSNNLPDSHENDWIIKFSSSNDPSDIGPIEYAYHLMALKAGLSLPEAKLFQSGKDRKFFGVKRFDRTKNDFLHMHTASGLLHADHRIPSLSYETLLKAALWLTKNSHEAEKIFRYAVFNVLAHNRDDHAKNFSFLMNKHGEWSVSPAYDLTFSSGPGGEHCTTVMGEGRNPSRTHLIKLAEVANIERSKAHLIIEQIEAAIADWPKFAEEAGVTRRSSDLIKKFIL